MNETDFILNDCLGDEETLFSMAMADIKNIPVLSKEEEDELGRKILEGDLEARNKLVLHNLRWAAKLANKAAQKSSFPAYVLYGELCLALVRAADKFDYRKGARFVTFSKYECDAALGKFTRKFSNATSMSEHDSEVLAALKLLQYNFHPEQPTAEELAQAYNKSHKRQIDAATVESMLDTLQTKSVNTVVGTDANSGSTLTLLDVIPARGGASSVAERSGERNLCLQALDTLEPRKAQIVRLFCGFDGEPLNHREIGERMGLSSERTRQLFKSACAELLRGPFAGELSALYNGDANERVS